MFGFFKKKDDQAQPASDMSQDMNMGGGDEMMSNPVTEPKPEMTPEEPASEPMTESSEEITEEDEMGEDDEEPASMGLISFDDFLKVEMSVGKVVNAEVVENADRLLRLEVDFGGEVRQVVSGIREYFSPEDLVDKKFSFVTNLEPRTIKGLESNGMIMAAKDEDNNFSLLSVDESVKEGTKLS